MDYPQKDCLQYSLFIFMYEPKQCKILKKNNENDKKVEQKTTVIFARILLD